ncbi:M20 family metallopeptidase [Microbacterium sp. ANT_H45B]|uniref:M20 family metallopeptidase n=1 Tax=Microbacterium sp. ANT_H45B TaxID=2597346 RepID=UPI0011ECC465|nr:M20 family metallopeptidase [Microbacterium sp. ANT_H45B]KAA0960018.1 M20 family metallopeptidase [Microbacterium sp. ANT_H45B]
MPSARTSEAGQLAEDSRFDLPEFLADLERLVTVESPSADHDAVARSALVLADVIQRRAGRRPEILRIDGVDHVVLQGRDSRVLLLGHHDTVWPTGSLAELPFSVEDGVIRGPGCFDMLVGVVQIAHALAMLRARHGDAVLDQVTVLVTGDEEVGSVTSRELIESRAVGCRAALVLEAAGPGGALKTQRKGVSLYELEVLGRAAHSGLEPERGINATVGVSHLVIALADLADPGAGTTVTPTLLSSGTTGNTVPDRATVAVDVRATTVAEQKRVDAAIRALGPGVEGATLVVHGGVNRPPLEAAASADLFARAANLAADLGHPPLRGMAVGGASDGNFTAGVGVPTLDGLGAVGGGAHARDEHAEIREIPARTELLVTLVHDLISDGS